MNDEIVLAKDIDDCSVCPLYEHDCIGGVSGTPNGYREPPCCSWNSNEEIYEGMYDREVIYDEWIQENQEHKEKESQERKERRTKEKAEQQIRMWSKYGNVRVEDAGELSDKWLCPRCHNWFRVCNPWRDGLIEKAHCPICHTDLAHSDYLD